MVKFGVRFEEGSASRHWQSSHVAYGALKKVLKRASQANGRPVGRSNYGPPGRGLLDLEEVRRPTDTFLERGLDDDDKRTLETLRGRLLKQNKEDDLSDEEEESKEYDEEVASLTPTSLNKKLWIRALDKDKSRAFFLHGFDCALAAEVATAERRYAREAASLERRWTAIAPSCRQYEDGLEASKAAPEPLKLQLAALDSEARALVDFVVWNLCAVEKISKKRDKLFPEEPPIRGRVVGILRARDAWTAPRARALSGQLRDACAALSGKTEQLGTAAAVSELRRLGTARGGEAPAPDESRRRAFEDLGRSASFDDTRCPSPTTSDEVEVSQRQPVASVSVCCFQRKRSKGVGLQPPTVGERLVFLDVDGVLHSINAHDKDTLNNACCDSLETIVRATDARLVLTGAWRLYPALVERVEALLKKRGLRPLLGKAPSLTAKGHNREREIRAWFVNNRPKKDPGRRWIALDAGRLDGLRGHLVRTDGEKGLTQLDATIATGLLRGDAGAFLLGCRPDKPCQFCDPRYDRGVPSCCGVFTSFIRLVSIRRGRGRFLFRFWGHSETAMLRAGGGSSRTRFELFPRLVGLIPTPQLPQSIRKYALQVRPRYTACCRRTACRPINVPYRRTSLEKLPLQKAGSARPPPPKR